MMNVINGVASLGGMFVLHSLLTLPGSHPIAVNHNSFILTPLTQRVHLAALNCLNDSEARKIQLLHYLAKPIDRVIQAVSIPIFTVIRGCCAVKEFVEPKPYLSGFDASFIRGFGFVAAITSPIWIAVGTFMSLIPAINLVANGIFQLVIPYQMAYNVYYGKEASRVFADFRNYETAPDINRITGARTSPLFGRVEAFFAYPFVGVEAPQSLDTYARLWEKADIPSSGTLFAASLFRDVPLLGDALALFAFCRPSLIQLFGRAVLLS